MEETYDIPTPKRLKSIRLGRALRWHDYADLWLNFPLGRLLDFGCGSGSFLQRLADRCDECHGVDIDPEKVEEAARAVPGAQVSSLRPDGSIPYEDESFDTVTMLEVIEHVADERRVLGEVERVLKRRGRLLLTTPHRGLLTFLDPGNFKFVVPGVHRFVHRTVLRRKGYYEGRFGRSRQAERGLIADFTTDQVPWHRHYAYEQIRSLAPVGLATLAWAVYYPGFRALWSVRLAARVLTFGRVTQLPPPLSWLDAWLSLRPSRMGDQLVVLFEKRS